MSLASMGRETVLESRGVGHLEESHTHSVLSPNPVEKASRIMQQSKTKVRGAHPSRVWCPASSPGTTRALTLMQVTLIFAKPLRNVVHLFSRCCPAGTPANYTRGRVCSPSHAMEDFPYERRRLSSRAFPSSGVRNYLVTVAAISKLRPCDSGGTRENRESGRCPDECEGVHLR